MSNGGEGTTGGSSGDRPRNANYVQSLERGLAVIRAFDAEHRDLGLSDVARAAGLTRAAARRFLLTLVELGYVSVSDGKFRLTPRVLELGYAYLSGLTLPEVAEPQSMGRVLLANLPVEELELRLAQIRFEPLSRHTVRDVEELRGVLEKVRKQGYAATDQELEEGLRSLAVPIHDVSGEVIAALNVSVHASRGTMTALRRDFLPVVSRTAAAIEADLRGARSATRTSGSR